MRFTVKTGLESFRIETRIYWLQMCTQSIKNAFAPELDWPWPGEEGEKRMLIEGCGKRERSFYWSE